MFSRKKSKPSYGPDAKCGLLMIDLLNDPNPCQGSLYIFSESDPPLTRGYSTNTAAAFVQV